MSVDDHLKVDRFRQVVSSVHCHIGYIWKASSWLNSSTGGLVPEDQSGGYLLHFTRGMRS